MGSQLMLETFGKPLMKRNKRSQVMLRVEVTVDVQLTWHSGYPEKKRRVQTDKIDALTR